MAIGAIQKHHLMRNVLLIKTMLGWCEKPINDLAHHAPGKFLGREMDFTFVPGGSSRLTKKITEDVAVLKEAVIERYTKFDQNSPNNNYLRLFVIAETARRILDDSPNIYSEVEEAQAYKDLLSFLTDLVGWLSLRLDEVLEMIGDREIYSMYNLVEARIIELDGERTWWFKGKRHTRSEDFLAAVKLAVQEGREAAKEGNDESK